MNKDYTEADLNRDLENLVVSGRKVLQKCCPYCDQKLPVGFSRELKECSRCHKERSISLYSKNKQSRDGHRSECKICANQYQIIYRSRHPHKVWAQRVLASRKQYGYAIKLTIAELEALAKKTSSCECGWELAWDQGSLHQIILKTWHSPHLITFSKIITLSSVRITCKKCAEAYWKRIDLVEEKILSEPELVEQPDVGGVKTVKLNFFGGEQKPPENV